MLHSIVVGVTGLVGPDRFLKLDDLDRSTRHSRLLDVGVGAARERYMWVA